MKQVVEAPIRNVLKDQHRDIGLQAAPNKADQVWVAVPELESDLIHNVIPWLKVVSTKFIAFHDGAFNRNLLLFISDSHEHHAERPPSNKGFVVVCELIQLNFCEYVDASCSLQYFTTIFVEEGSLHSPLSIHVNKP